MTDTHRTHRLSAYFARLEPEADLRGELMDSLLHEQVSRTEAIVVSPVPTPITSWSCSVTFFPRGLSRYIPTVGLRFRGLAVGLLLGSAIPVMWLVFWKE